MTAEEKRNFYISALSEMPDIVVAAAFACAQALVDYGVGSLQRFDNILEMKEELDKAYAKGRYDELEWQKRHGLIRNLQGFTGAKSIIDKTWHDPD